MVSSSFQGVGLAEHSASHFAFQVCMLLVNELIRTARGGHQILLDSYQFSSLQFLHSIFRVYLKPSPSLSFNL